MKFSIAGASDYLTPTDQFICTFEDQVDVWLDTKCDDVPVYLRWGDGPHGTSAWWIQGNCNFHDPVGSDYRADGSYPYLDDPEGAQRLANFITALLALKS